MLFCSRVIRSYKATHLLYIVYTYSLYFHNMYCMLYMVFIQCVCSYYVLLYAPSYDIYCVYIQSLFSQHVLYALHGVYIVLMLVKCNPKSESTRFKPASISFKPESAPSGPKSTPFKI